MRKAKTPPKRKPVPAGRRAAKRKAEKGAGARAGKVVAKRSKSAKPSKSTKPGKLAKVAKAGKSASLASAGGHAKAPAKASVTSVEKTGKKLVKTLGNSGKSPGNKVTLAPATATPKPSTRSTARPVAAAAVAVAKVAPATPRASHEAKDLRKAAPERPSGGTIGGASRGDAAGPATPSSEKPVEPAAPVGLPTPIASFTI